MYTRLQYISSGRTSEQQIDQIWQALDAGADWIQLRGKALDKDTFIHTAQQVKKLQEQYKFTYIINDFTAIAAAVDADGVHLGLADQSVAEARLLLGAHKIIGGTANTFSDVQQRIAEGCEYIGLGPLRFTTSKAKLSPILGFDGYSAILQQLAGQAHPPIYAIGAVAADDIERLRAIGLHGIAVSSLINEATAKKQTILNLQSLLHGTLTTTR